MADIKAKFGDPATLTLTLASLANSGARQSDAIDNSTSLYTDILVSLKVKTGASGTASTGTVNVYACASVDGGTTYTEGAGASDAGITLTAPPNARLIGVINAVANATTYVGGPFSVAAAFGGVCPQRVVIVAENKTGGTLDSTEGSHAKLYQGVLAQVG